MESDGNLLRGDIFNPRVSRVIQTAGLADDPRGLGKKTAKMGYSLWLHGRWCAVTMPMSGTKTC